MIRPILEYVSLVSMVTQDLYKIEGVQQQSAGFILGDYSTYNSVSNMLDTLNLPNLDQRPLLRLNKPSY